VQNDGAPRAQADNCCASIASRALSQLDVPFRLHGRRAHHALDCVGLVAYALWGEEGLSQLPGSYSMRGHHGQWITQELRLRGLQKIDEDTLVRHEDIMIFYPSSRQLHLGIALRSGLVHAHAGLGRITLTPRPWPWQQIAVWRQNGD